MNLSRFRRILFLSLAFFSINLFAMETIVLETCKDLPIGKFIEYLEDKDKNVKLEDLHRSEIVWKKSLTNNLHFGFTSSRYWLKFAVQNSSNSLQECILDTGSSRIDIMDFYSSESEFSYREVHTGDTFPYSQRDIDHINFAFKIQLKPKETKNIFLSFSSKYNVSNLDPKLVSLDTLLSSTGESSTLNGIFYGFMIIMFFYNFALYVQIKEKVYLYFSLYMFFYFFYFLGFHGTGFRYLYSNFPWFQNRDYHIALTITLFFSTSFANTFLDLKKQMPKGYYVNQLILILLGVWFVLNLFYVLDKFPKFSFLFFNNYLLFAILVMIFNSIYLAIKKSRQAYFYLSAWILFFIASIFRILAVNQIIPLNSITMNSLQIGVSCTIVLLSLGLADKLNQLKIQLQESKDKLEHKVIERTQELTESLVQVRKLKEIQDGDYFLNTLLIEPFAKNNSQSETVFIEFFIKQKKVFFFHGKEYELGGDINISENIKLMDKNYIVFLNGDAMGKSIQGAGGVIVLGTVFKSILQRTWSFETSEQVDPEKWVCNAFLEMHNAFVSFEGSMLVSAVFGLLNENSGEMYFINIEHPDVVLYRDGVASFIRVSNDYRKLGAPWQTVNPKVEQFFLKPKDVIILGSDGRDDIILGKDSDGYNVLNKEEELFLTHVENAKGDLNEIYNSILKTGELVDDLSLLRIQFLSEKI